VSPNDVAMTGFGDNETDLDAGERSYSGGGYFPPGVFQGGGLFGGLFGQRPYAPQYPGTGQQYPGAARQVPGMDQYGDLRPRNNDEQRWFPPRRIDPDVPWRDRQRGGNF